MAYQSDAHGMFIHHPPVVSHGILMIFIKKTRVVGPSGLGLYLKLEPRLGIRLWLELDWRFGWAGAELRTGTDTVVKAGADADTIVGSRTGAGAKAGAMSGSRAATRESSWAWAWAKAATTAWARTVRGYGRDWV